MAQNYNYYAIIGNNGYGMSPDWPDIVSYAKLLEGEWHRGFQTEEEAYGWLKEQVGMRGRLNASGMCDLATLRSQRLVIADQIRRSVQETFYRKPAPIEEVSSLEELEETFKELASKKADKEKARKKALVKHFEKWLDTYLNDND